MHVGEWPLPFLHAWRWERWVVPEKVFQSTCDRSDLPFRIMKLNFLHLPFFWDTQSKAQQHCYEKQIKNANRQRASSIYSLIMSIHFSLSIIQKRKGKCIHASVMAMIEYNHTNYNGSLPRTDNDHDQQVMPPLVPCNWCFDRQVPRALQHYIGKWQLSTYKLLFQQLLCCACDMQRASCEHTGMCICHQYWV